MFDAPMMLTLVLGLLPAPCLVPSLVLSGLSLAMLGGDFCVGTGEFFISGCRGTYGVAGGESPGLLLAACGSGGKEQEDAEAVACMLGGCCRLSHFALITASSSPRLSTCACGDASREISKLISRLGSENPANVF